MRPASGWCRWGGVLPTAESLIVSRALLGVAGPPWPRPLVADLPHVRRPKQRSIAIGFWIGAFSAGAAIGPVLADPMIDVGLFTLGRFNAALATNFLAIFVAVGSFLFVAQYLQLVVGLSPLEAGLWSLPSAFGFIIGSQLAPGSSTTSARPL